eukprot:2643603-Rhodomonas_salina.1
MSGTDTTLSVYATSVKCTVTVLLSQLLAYATATKLAVLTSSFGTARLPFHPKLQVRTCQTASGTKGLPTRLLSSYSKPSTDQANGATTRKEGS